MHRELVDDKRLGSRRACFFGALNFSMLLPGPEAMELSVGYTDMPAWKNVPSDMPQARYATRGRVVPRAAAFPGASLRRPTRP